MVEPWNVHVVALPWKNISCDGYTARIRHVWCQKWDSLMLESWDTYSRFVWFYYYYFFFIYFLLKRKCIHLWHALYPNLTWSMCLQFKMDIEGDKQMARSTATEGLFTDTAGWGDVGHSLRKNTQDAGPGVRPRREALERLAELQIGRAADAYGEDFRRYDDIVRPRVRQPDVEDVQIPNLGIHNKRPKVMPD